VNAALVISTRDNVATALELLEPGRTLDIPDRTITVRDRIPPGHKVAIVAIASGCEVLKYGSAIGTATTDIAVGAHVHTHNVASSRGRGDLAPEAPETNGALMGRVSGDRLAEPEA
jgi:altronate dehydratase small subunit